MKQIKYVIIAIAITVFLAGLGMSVMDGMDIEPVYSARSERLKKEIMSGGLNTSKKTNPNVRDDTGNPLFFYAIDLETAEQLVRYYHADLSQLNNNGESVLHHIIKEILGFKDKKRVSVLKYYLRSGLDPGQPDLKTGVTPRQLLDRKTCKGELFPWDNETLLLVDDPENDLLAPHDYGFDHKFENPFLRVLPVDPEYSDGYKPGYEFYAEDKSEEDGDLILSFRGNILNKSLSLDIDKDTYDFETCQIKDNAWVCQNRTTGEYEQFKSPDVVLSSSLSQVDIDSSRKYPSSPSYKNLQPNRIILGFNADVPDNFTVSGNFGPGYDFDSVRLYYGNWVGNR